MTEKEPDHMSGSFLDEERGKGTEKVKQITQENTGFDTS